MADLKMVETFDGGDIVFSGRDLVVIDGFQNMPYLGMFGGNVKQSTKEFNVDEQRGDFWGNSLLMLGQPEIQYNSDTERLLNTTALNSTSRLLIEQTIKKDLDFMTKFAKVVVAVSIIGPDRISITIEIREPNNTESNVFSYIWDSTKLELTNGTQNNGFGQGIALDYPLNFGL